MSEPEPVAAEENGIFGSLELEPLEKITRSRSRLEKKSRAGAAKKLAGWKIKSIRKLYFCCASLDKIVSVYG